MTSGLWDKRKISDKRVVLPFGAANPVPQQETAKDKPEALDLQTRHLITHHWFVYINTEAVHKHAGTYT